MQSVWLSIKRSFHSIYTWAQYWENTWKQIIISLGLNICWLYRLICWLLNKSLPMFLTWVAHQGGFFNFCRTWHCKGTTCLWHWYHGLTIVLHCPVLAKASWPSWVRNCSRRSGKSCPAHNGLSLGWAAQWSTKLTLIFLVAKTKSRESAEMQRKESAWWKATIKRTVSFSSLCKSETRKAGWRWSFPSARTAGEAQVSRGASEDAVRMFPVCQNCWGGDAGCRRLGRLPLSSPHSSFATWSSKWHLLPILPSPHIDSHSGV